MTRFNQKSLPEEVLCKTVTKCEWELKHEAAEREICRLHNWACFWGTSCFALFVVLMIKGTFDWMVK